MPAGKITAGSILLLIPLFNFFLLAGVLLLVGYPIIKILKSATKILLPSLATSPATLTQGADK